MELFRAVDCLDYTASEPRLPALQVRVKEPLFGREKRFIAPIDTGYAGYLLVPAETYARLGTMELPREDFGVYSTMTGPITLRRAEVKLHIGDKELYTFIETPMHWSGKTLLGRRILRELDLALLGGGQKCCHLTPSQS
jgi:clan AA aspartic protease